MKTEIKVILAVVAALLMGEVGARLFEPRLSADIRQILGFEEFPQKIAESRAEGQTIVLVLGNSLARSGVDEVTLEAGLRKKGWARPKIFYLTPDASGVNEWTAAYRKIFPGSGAIRPDLLILVTGPGHLLDHPVRSPERLAAYHASRKDRVKIFCEWLNSESERCRFLLASVSRLFVIRERVRPLLFYDLVPGYEVTARQLNQAVGQGIRDPSEAGGTAVRFRMLLDSLDLPAKRVVLAAAPLPEIYQIPDVVLEAASERGITVFQEVAGVGLPPEAFPDGYHLGAEFSDEFTSRLAKCINLARLREGEHSSPLQNGGPRNENGDADN